MTLSISQTPNFRMYIFLLFFFAILCDSKLWQRESENLLSLVILSLFVVFNKVLYVLLNILEVLPPNKLVPCSDYRLSILIASLFSLYLLFTLLCPLKNWHIIYKDYINRFSCPVASDLFWSVRSINNRWKGKRMSLWSLFI